jgi:branched-chain amino acid transport system permease protein
MDIVNRAHASYYLLGGYVALTASRFTGNFYLGLISAIIVVIIIAVAMERFFLRRLAGRLLGQVLMTVGFMFFFQDLCLWIWGGDPQWVKAPDYLTKILTVGPLTFAEYRIFLIAVAVAVVIGLWWLQEKTKFGARLRASVDDREMAEGVGIRLPYIYSGAFALGGGLAALSGVVGSAYLSVYPGIDLEILIYAFVANIVGGMGSLRGAFVGAMVLGLIDNFAKALYPEISYFSLFAPMVIILAVRPTGLFGREV